jgi:hypothetical protein
VAQTDHAADIEQIATLQRMLAEARTRLPSEFQLDAVVTRRDSNVVLTVVGVYFTRRGAQVRSQYRLSDGSKAEGCELKMLVGADRGITA